MADAQTYLTPSELRDQMVAYFSQPGIEFAFNGDKGVCQYRTPDGRKCAVGCLIPDEAYEPWLDDTYNEEYWPTFDSSASQMVEHQPDFLRKIGIDPEDLETIQFLVGAQRTHDTESQSNDPQPARFVEWLKAQKFRIR